MWFLDRRVILFFNFSRNLRTGSKRLHRFAFPPAAREGSPLSASSPTPGVSRVADFSHSDRCEVITSVSPELISASVWMFRCTLARPHASFWLTVSFSFADAPLLRPASEAGEPPCFVLSWHPSLHFLPGLRLLLLPRHRVYGTQTHVSLRPDFPSRLRLISRPLCFLKSPKCPRISLSMLVLLAHWPFWSQ